MLIELLFVFGLFPLCLSARGQNSLKATCQSYWGLRHRNYNEQYYIIPKHIVNFRMNKFIKAFLQ